MELGMNELGCIRGCLMTAWWHLVSSGEIIALEERMSNRANCYITDRTVI